MRDSLKCQIYKVRRVMGGVVCVSVWGAYMCMVVWLHTHNSTFIPPKTPNSQMGARTNRGQLANLDQQNEMINLVAQLEALGAARSLDPTDVEGRWELVYSDCEPFRVSPFFMTVRVCAQQNARTLVCLLLNVPSYTPFYHP